MLRLDRWFRNLAICASAMTVVIFADLAPEPRGSQVCARVHALTLDRQAFGAQVANYGMDRGSPPPRNVGRRSAAGGQGML